MGRRLIGLYSPFADPLTQAKQLTVMMYGINGHISTRAEIEELAEEGHPWTEAEIDEVLDNLHAAIARAEEERRRRERPVADYMGLARDWHVMRVEQGTELNDRDWRILTRATRHEYTEAERALIESGD